MASTNTLPVPKLTYLGWQSGHGFLKHRSSFGSVPRVLILHPRDLGLVPFFPIFGQFHVLDPSSALPSSVPLVHLLFLNPFSLRLALLLSIKLHVSCLHSSLASRVPHLPFQTRLCSLSNPSAFPFRTRTCFLSNRPTSPFDSPMRLPVRNPSLPFQSCRFERNLAPIVRSRAPFRIRSNRPHNTCDDGAFRDLRRALHERVLRALARADPPGSHRRQVSRSCTRKRERKRRTCDGTDLFGCHGRTRRRETMEEKKRMEQLTRIKHKQVLEELREKGLTSA